jgi:hypothetical protein
MWKYEWVRMCCVCVCLKKKRKLGQDHSSANCVLQTTCIIQVYMCACIYCKFIYEREKCIFLTCVCAYECMWVELLLIVFFFCDIFFLLKKCVHVHLFIFLFIFLTIFLNYSCARKVECERVCVCATGVCVCVWGRRRDSRVSWAGELCLLVNIYANAKKKWKFTYNNQTTLNTFFTHAKYL